MKTWTTQLVTITEVPFDHDLPAFNVHTLNEVFLGTIYPANIEDAESLVADLDGGGCPIADHWEDGNGNDCTLKGWGTEKK